MSMMLIEHADGRVVEVRARGKLRHEDYEQFVPLCEDLIERYGQIRVLFRMDDFHGWDVMALWDDLKFDLAHFRDIERLALVGDAEWERRMATFCKPFTSATIRYFDHADVNEAQDWILEELPVHQH